MHASPLPAPLHTAPSFLRFHFLSAKDKLVISRALAALTLSLQPDTGQILPALVAATSVRTQNAIQERFTGSPS